MLPVSDDNPAFATPIVSWTLIGLCVAVFLYQLSLGFNTNEGLAFVLSYGMVPYRLFENPDWPAGLAAPEPALTLVTSMFLHGGILHLLGNMLYLWIFGDNVEAAMGKVRFIMFYLVCGVTAALAQAFMDPDTQIPMVGASGAISGVLGAYLLLYPTANVRILVFLGFFITTFRVPALVVLGLWFVFQLLSAQSLQEMGQEGGVAFMAHIGGFVAGMVLIRFFRRPTRGPWEDRHRARWLR
ncbi:MAG: rhomboid family intramembrane serine protease [Alphaproteobacteria bacterium]